MRSAGESRRGKRLAALLCVKKLKRTRQRTPTEAVRASQGGQTSRFCAAFGQRASRKERVWGTRLAALPRVKTKTKRTQQRTPGKEGPGASRG